MLQGKNYKVKKAIDGETALLAAQSNPPDLILLDIMMPDMDGYQVCEKLKLNPTTQDIPVIFISALNNTFDKVKAFEVGAIDYVTKPFQEEEVLARINSQLIIQYQKRLLKREQKIFKKEIRQRKETEAILYQSRAILSSVLNASVDAIAAVEAVRKPHSSEIEDFRCLVVNPVVAKIFDRDPEDLTGKLVVKNFLNKVKPELFLALMKVVETGKTVEKEIQYQHKSIHKWFHLIAVKLGDGFSITIRDITKKKELELKLNKIATIDSLTQIYNRYSFDVKLQETLQHCTKEHQPLSLIMCDIDYFKNYNEFYGHQQGDQCLIKVAEILNNIIAQNTEQMLVFRYGGEKFAIILPNISLKVAVEIAQNIRQTIQDLKLPHRASLINGWVSLTFGVTTVNPNPNNDPDLLGQLITKADNALSKAKNGGRNQVRAEKLIDNY